MASLIKIKIKTKILASNNYLRRIFEHKYHDRCGFFFQASEENEIEWYVLVNDGSVFFLSVYRYLLMLIQRKNLFTNFKNTNEYKYTIFTVESWSHFEKDTDLSGFMYRANLSEERKVMMWSKINGLK